MFYWAIVNNDTNEFAINSATHAQDSSLAGSHETFVDLGDSLSTTEQDAQQNSGKYLYQNGSFVQRPNFTLDYASGTVTATLNNTSATPPSTVTFEIEGSSYTAPVTTGMASLAVAIHPSVAEQTIQVQVSSPGFANALTNIGGSKTDIALQSFIKTGATTPTVAPTGVGSKSFLSDYWTSTATSAAYTQADIGTWLSLLLDTMYGFVVPAITGGTTPLASLDPNQSNAVTDIQSNLLPSLITTLKNAAPKPATGATQIYDIHYAHGVNTFAATKTAMQNYANDLATIPNLA